MCACKIFLLIIGFCGTKFVWDDDRFFPQLNINQHFENEYRKIILVI